MRRLLIMCAGLAVLALAWFAFRKPHTTHELTLLTYFQDGAGIKSGASVRIDGVDLGSVTGVMVRPELGDHPVEVVMTIATPYELSIPSDATVTLATQGVLGPSLLDIDTRNTQGHPIANKGVLRSVEVAKGQAAHVIEHVGNALVQASKDMKDHGSQPANNPLKRTSPPR